MRAVLRWVPLVLVVASGCAAATPTLSERDADEKLVAADDDDGTSSAAATGPASPSATTPPPAATPPKPPVPVQAPRAGQRISDPSRVWRVAGAFAAQAPTVRANDRHATPVTGIDCMTCHGNTGAAPRFAFAGTMSAGKNWTWAPRGWRPPEPPRASYDDYGYSGYDDYDDYGYDEYRDDYGYDEYDSYDDYYGSGDRSRKGWPSDRTAPSTGTELRIIDARGDVFETVTDADGNFWFKATAEVQAPAFTGVRKGAFTITGRSNGMACGGCHETGRADSPGRIWTWDGALPRR